MLPGVEGCIVSSKIYGIMAVGQPVIMVGSTKNEISDLLARSGAGFSVGQGCADELAGRIRELRDSPETARNMGEAGRRYYEEQLGRKRSLAKLVGIITEQ
jgi:glycosyltransferase involved in cell wall biosynthesis